MKPGQGHALFTAECAHSFHFNCIASSVKHGNHLCPICRRQWKEVPFQAPIVISPYQSNGRGHVSPLDNVNIALQPHLSDPQPISEPLRYDDDDPLLPSSPVASSPHRCVATIGTFPEFPAIPASMSTDGFTTLVSLHAPPTLDHRAPIDLVAVLDVSGSMAGTKLVLLKRAVRFVTHHLSPSDRLAVIAFSSSARRVLSLRRMTDEGRDCAILAVNSLQSGGGTNIVEGLRKGIRILHERRERNPVSSILLLSDGKDTYTTDNHGNRRNLQQQSSNSKQLIEYLNLLPPSPHCGDGSSNRGCTPIPIHTFGFGTDHDAPAMHALSDATGGTFSFIEAEAAIQDAFARCIGGLLSVVAQELQLTLSSAFAGVSICKIPAGNYSSGVSERGRRGIINVGDLYADESKDFLVHLLVPIFLPDSEQDAITPLFTVQCSYRDPTSQEMIHVDGETVKIRRPEALTTEDQTVCIEVDRQRNRLLVAEAIAEAQVLAEKGSLEDAQLVLANRRAMLLASASSQAGDTLCSWLEAELKEIRERMASREMYEVSGRSYVLSGLSSHSWQRATTRGDSTVVISPTAGRENGLLSQSGPVGYETPSMTNMVTRSQTLFFSAPEPVHLLRRSGSLALPRGV